MCWIDYATTLQDAFDKYPIATYNKTSQINEELKYQKCLKWISNSVEVYILAHTKSLELSNKEFLILLKEIIHYGLKGIDRSI